MLTRVLFLFVVLCGMAGAAWAEDAKVVALGISDHEVTQEELDKGAPLAAPHFNTPAVAYALVANVKKGDEVEVALSNDEKPLLRNSATLSEDQATTLLQAGKRGVPAGGWPQEWKYSASVKVTRDGKTLIEQKSVPIPFD
jgi:hypothetical protein